MKKECPICKKIFNVKPSRYGRTVTCSMECGLEHRKSKRKSVTRKCVSCGKKLNVVPSREKYGRGQNCSRECQYKRNSELLRKEKIKLKCLCCKEVFQVSPSLLNMKNGAGKYCSMECKTKHRKGKNHPQYINGKSGEKRGPHWQARKRKAKNRDNHTCTKCGITEEQCKEKYNDYLHVHHIIPYRLFESDSETANRLDNLVTLCPKCHRKEDSKIQSLLKDKLSTNDKNHSQNAITLIKENIIKKNKK